MISIIALPMGLWFIPDDAESGGCLSAWEDMALLGRSRPLELQHLDPRKRSEDSIPMTNASGIDTSGPWFDGVALLKQKDITHVNVEEAKSKKIAIVGAGMSGLMTFLNLQMSGFTNVEIIEAGDRLGGRIHTEYLEGGSFDYQYQELGAMRFPESITYPEKNETLKINDHRLVFQLAEKLNQLNDHNQNFSIDFIPWLQKSPNGLSYMGGIRNSDGTVPTVTEVEKDPSLAPPTPETDPALEDLQKDMASILGNPELMAGVATNMYTAHKAFIDSGPGGLGGEDWSEFAYIHNHLKYSLNVTDQFLSSLGVPGSGADSFWDLIVEYMYFASTGWRTIDGGLNRLPLAFHPLVDNATTMNRKIERVDFSPETNQVSLSWKDSFRDKTFQNASYDYAVVSAPFSMVRKWRLPTFSTTLASAIKTLPYDSGCKVVLQFESRFWEHAEQPIYGSCSTTTDIPGIGQICYPSYNINGTGPGTIIGSFATGFWGHELISLSEEEHVQYVLDAMIEIHGDVAREQYTGVYRRKCWLQDSNTSGGWAYPEIGQHKLYIPAYFQTENNIIFVGEHTSYTHAWVASALESGVRGSVQLLLELGLVDEAKEVSKKWMARWMSV